MNKSVLFFLLVVVLVAGCVGRTQPPTTPEPGSPITFRVVPDKLFPNARVGEPYSYSFCKPDLDLTSDLCDASAVNPTGGNPPYSFSLGPGTGFPPFGLTLNLNGILSGTPTAEGERLFEVCAKDLSGNQDCQKVTLEVEPSPPPPTTTTAPTTTPPPPTPPPTTPPPTTTPPPPTPPPTTPPPTPSVEGVWIGEISLESTSLFDYTVVTEEVAEFSFTIGEYGGIEGSGNAQVHLTASGKCIGESSYNPSFTLIGS